MIKLDNFACNTRQAGILIPVTNIMNMIETMSNYCASTRENRFNEFTIDCLAKFIQWLDGMANTKPKYYNIVMVENLKYIISRLDIQELWNEWIEKKNELNQQYQVNVKKYVQYIFEYQFPKYTEYMQGIKISIKGNTSLEGKYTSKSFENLVSSTFSSFAKSCKKMKDRMKKHLKSSESINEEIWGELETYIKNEYQILETIVEKYYSDLVLSPTKEEIIEKFESID